MALRAVIRSFVLGAAAGAAAVYFNDPERGGQRRELFAEKASTTINNLSQVADDAKEIAGQASDRAQDLAEEAQVLAHQAKSDAQDLAHQAGSDAHDLAHQANDEGQELAHQANGEGQDVTEQAMDFTQSSDEEDSTAFPGSI